MNKSKTLPPNAQHFAIKAGLKIMVVPCLYWLAVFSATLFEKPVFIKWLLFDDQTVTRIFIYLVMIMLPLITLLMNIMTRYNRTVSDVIRSRYSNRLQLMVIALSVMSLAGTFCYTFFERLHFWLFVTQS